STDAIPVTFATKSTWDAVSATLPAAARRFAVANAFTAKPGQYLASPAEDGSLAHVSFGIEDASSEWRDLFRPGQLPGSSPAGTYSFDYQICEKSNPTNCATGKVSITVIPAPIGAVDDTVAGSNGGSGAVNVRNASGGDTSNGQPATVATVTSASVNASPT
ncbi:hypothetical protein OY671_009203, partial [Metschnikowia pulcherrima]